MTRTRTTALLEQELAEFARKNQELRQENERLKSQIVVLSSELAFEQKQAEERGARSAFEMVSVGDWGAVADNEVEEYMTEWKRRRNDGK